jgi:hypothetical protein
MAYLDEFFAASFIHHEWTKEQCLIVPMSSLKLAIKLFEPRTMNMDWMLRQGMSMGCSFSSNDVVGMEHQIMMHLSWDMFPPTAFCFVCHMICMFPHEVRMSPTGYIVQEIAQYVTELSVCKCHDRLRIPTFP